METPLGGFLRRAGEGKPVLDFDQFEIKLGSLPEQLAAVAGSPVPPPRVGVPTFSHASGISFPRPDTYNGDPEGLELFIFGIREWLLVQGVDLASAMSARYAGMFLRGSVQEWLVLRDQHVI
jgi:hypothetical protein